jgi:hypothetical protein
LVASPRLSVMTVYASIVPRSCHLTNLNSISTNLLGSFILQINLMFL